MKSIPRCQVVRIIDGDDELKKNHDVPNNSRYRFAAIKKHEQFLENDFFSLGFIWF